MRNNTSADISSFIESLCPDGVNYVPLKDIFTRLKGTPITATQMKEIATPQGDVHIFAGGKTQVTLGKRTSQKPISSILHQSSFNHVAILISFTVINLLLSKTKCGLILMKTLLQ